MIRTDNRLLDGAPMRPVRCHQCGTSVDVRKAGWQQTSIQWNAEAVRACLERRASHRGGGPNGDRFPSCESLRESIRQAVLDGTIRVPDE